jgi:hypothetical protein
MSNCVPSFSNCRRFIFSLVFQRRKFFSKLDAFFTNDDSVDVLAVLVFDFMGKDVRVDKGHVENLHRGIRLVPLCAIENVVLAVNDYDSLGGGDGAQGSARPDDFRVIVPHGPEDIHKR